MRTKYIKIHPNEKSDSNKINKNVRDISEDISDLYKSTIEAKNDVEVQNALFPHMVDGIDSRLNTLENQLASLNTGVTILSMYSLPNVYYPTSISSEFHARHEALFGEVSLPITATDVEYHFTNPVTGERSIIQDAYKYVKSFITNNRFKPKVDEIFENSVVNSIDQNTDKIHLTKVITTNPEIDNITSVYNLQMQETKLINTIRIYPLPETMVAYEGINVSGPSLANAVLFDYTGTELEFTDENGVPLETAKKKTFRFPDTELNDISIQLNNRNYRTVGDDGREFIVGARLISVEYNTYLSEGYFGVRLDATSRTTLTKLDPVIEGEPSKIEVFVYRTKEAFDQVSGHSISGYADTIQNAPDLGVADVDYIYVLFKIRKHDNNTTPLIKGLVATW